MAKMSFEAIARKTQRKTETVFHEFAQDMAETVLVRTPVDTGFLKGSWFAGINTDAGPAGNPDPSGAQTIASISVNIQQAEIGDYIVIGNNANYANFVEKGTVNMAPRAMVGSTIRDANQIMLRTVMRISKT